MAYKFTTDEMNQITAARWLAPSDNKATTTGNWVSFYQTLSNIIAEHITNNDVAATDLQDLKNAKLWLDVAIGANGGTGIHNAFIRAFTNREGELRLGTEFTAEKMQLASNGVALNFWLTLTGQVPVAGYTPCNWGSE